MYSLINDLQYLDHPKSTAPTVPFSGQHRTETGKITLLITKCPESKTRRAFPLVLVPDIHKMLYREKSSVILAEKKKI